MAQVLIRVATSQVWKLGMRARVKTADLPIGSLLGPLLGLKMLHSALARCTNGKKCLRTRASCGAARSELLHVCST